MDATLRPVGFDQLPGWSQDDPRPLFPAMGDCLRHIRTEKPYRTGEIGVTADELAAAFDHAPAEPADAAEARAFFEHAFVPVDIKPNKANTGLVTAFYEPEVEVRALPDTEFNHPFYSRPADLVALDGTNRPGELDPSYAFGRLGEDGSISAYPDRRAIDCGALRGRSLEIAWARSRVEVFFAHVQGAARLIYPDGKVRRITYDGKAGHPFSAIGRLLVDEGHIALSDISMQSIKAWLADHPDEMDRVLWHNRSYIFFRDADVADLTLGPIAAAKVPLIAGRSLAVDKTIHTFASPFYIDAPDLTRLDAGKPFRRLMLALDTGTAIVGPARGDIFTGSGHAAGEAAGAVRNEARFTLLMPKAAAERLLR